MLDTSGSIGARETVDEDIDRLHYLIRHLTYITGHDDGVIVLRDGDVMASVLVDGINADTADGAEIDGLSAAFAAVIAQAEPDVGFYVHRFSLRHAPRLGPVGGDTPFAAEVARRWQASLDATALRARRTMISVVIRPSKLGSTWARLVSGGRRETLDGLKRRAARLEEVVAFLSQAIARARPSRLTLSGGDWLGYLGVLVSGQFRPLGPGLKITARPLADGLADASVDFRGDTFRYRGACAAERRYGAMFSLKSYPGQTEPGLFDVLDLPFDSVLTQSFTPVPSITALERIKRTIRQMSAADDAARSLRLELEDAADDVASGRSAFGHHHLSLAVFARSEEELEEASARARSATQSVQATLTREGLSNRTAYFAQHPGNFAYRARAAMISSTNFAHFTALHGVPPGLPRERTPWGEAVMLMPTASGEVYRLNLHARGAPGERTVGHTLIVGMTGSGKTLFSAFLMAEAHRLGPPRIIAFDKDRGLEAAIRAMGGHYEPVRLGQPTGLNPFAAETDERGTAWLADWVTALAERQGDLSAIQREAIANAAATNALTDPGLRTITGFRQSLRSVDDDGELHTRLGLWDADGQNGWLFAGRGDGETGGSDDALRFERDVTAFDTTDVLDVPEVRTAWLSYVFRRIERTVEDARPTLIVLDEAWKLLDDPYFEARIKDWMLTMRKKNVAVVLMSQRLAHFTESRAGGSIVESVATTILFPNRRFSREELAPLRLTEGELGFVTEAPAGRQMLVRGPEESVLLNVDLSALAGLVGVLGGGAGERLAPGWRDDPDFWRAHA